MPVVIYIPLLPGESDVIIKCDFIFIGSSLNNLPFSQTFVTDGNFVPSKHFFYSLFDNYKVNTVPVKLLKLKLGPSMPNE